MKFQVGDKVEFVMNYGSFRKGDVVKVTGIWPNEKGVEYEGKGITGNCYNERIRMVKPTKNQRITALESVVKDLEQKIIDIRNDYRYDLKQVETRIKMLEFKLEEQTKLIPPTIQSVEDKPFDWIDEPLDEELTPNQQRAEIIEKAKKFVEVKSECVKDSPYVKGGIARKKIENPNFYNYAAFEVEFIINQEKRTVVSLVKFNDGSIMTKGIAKCNPSDVFNEHIGKAIALGRALGLDVSEFENAVQPNEIVVGMVIKGNESENRFYRKSRKFTLTSETDRGGFYYSEASEYSGKPSNDYVLSCQIGDIFDDTNAQYGEVK